MATIPQTNREPEERDLKLQIANLTAQLEQQKLEGSRTRTSLRDAQDVLTLKERFTTDLERQIVNSVHTNEQLSLQLATTSSELSALRASQTDFPLSDMDLLFRYERLSKLFERIREALSCAICYEFFGKSKAGVTVLEDQPHKSEERGAGAISLLCGHSFCTECWKTWEAKHVANFKASSVQGVYNGADCPECRSIDVRRGRVRIWAMEEVVRLVESGAKELETLYTPSLLPAKESSE